VIFSVREKKYTWRIDAAFKIRTASTIIFIVSVLLLIAMKGMDVGKLLLYAGIISIVVIAAAAVIAVAAAIDFNRCFVIFHKLFFDNDLWLLDPEKDMIINILVEPFFADMALKIAGYCSAVLAVLVGSGACVYITDKKRRNI